MVTGAFLAVEEAGGGARIYASAPDYAELPSGAVVGGELRMPSFAHSGLKVDLPIGGLTVPATGAVDLVVDFDVAQSFGHQAGQSGAWVMHPVIKATGVTVTGPATKLAFTVQPSGVAAGAVMAPAVQVAVLDAQDRTLGSSTAEVTLAITPGSGTAGAVLGGTLTQTAVNGVATFADLTIDKAGSGYTLAATAPGLTSAVSGPFTVTGGAGALVFQSVVAGEAWTCALTPAGAAYCWGLNSSGQLGDGTTIPRLTPVAVSMPAGLGFARLVTGFAHACGLTATGAAYCWGLNGYGQLGDNTTANRLTPGAVTMPAGVAFATLVSGEGHSCGLTAAGAAYCWGSNLYGQLGDGTTTDRLTPVAVTMPAGVTYASLAGGAAHSCGLTAAGAAYCWGHNAYGQLGDGTTTDRLTPVPVTLPAEVTFTGLASAGNHTCGLTAAGAAHCWGANTYGQLGDGTAVQRLTPVAVTMPAGVTFASLASQHVHTCGLTAAGAAYCWGANSSGQLGDGTTIQRLTPAAVTMPADVTFASVAVGYVYSCGRSAAGAAYCWGWNGYGQLGDGTTTNRLTPVAVLTP